MCGRYTTPTSAEAERNLTIDLLLGAWEPSYNLAPTQLAPVIHWHDGQMVLQPMRFGLVPYFARGEAPTYSTINCTIERLMSGPTWRGPWARAQRCLVLATGFYEWQVQADGRSKQPYFIKPADQDVFAFAGLWDASTAPDGRVTHSFAIVTLPASPLMEGIHNVKKREPAILAREDTETWLRGAPDAAYAALRAYPDELLSAWPVSTRVNAPKNNDPTLTDQLTMRSRPSISADAERDLSLF